MERFYFKVSDWNLVPTSSLITLWSHLIIFWEKEVQYCCVLLTEKIVVLTVPVILEGGTCQMAP